MQEPLDTSIQPETSVPSYNADEELKSWGSFVMEPNEQDFGALYDMFEPTIENAINKYGGMNTNVPRAAIQGQAIIQFDKALRSYKPEMGAKLSSWVHSQMRPLQRFMRDNQDIAHIPDNRAMHIYKLRERTMFLTDKLGREPSTEELSDDTKLPFKTVSQLQKELKKDLLAEEGLESFAETDNVEVVEDRARALMMDLKGHQQVILEHLLGLNGKPKYTVKQISKKINLPESRVRYEQKMIREKWQDYFEHRE